MVSRSEVWIHADDGERRKAETVKVRASVRAEPLSERKSYWRTFSQLDSLDSRKMYLSDLVGGLFLGLITMPNELDDTSSYGDGDLARHRPILFCLGLVMVH